MINNAETHIRNQFKREYYMGEIRKDLFADVAFVRAVMNLNRLTNR